MILENCVFKDVLCGYDHSFAMTSLFFFLFFLFFTILLIIKKKKDNSVYVWGKSDKGQLGYKLTDNNGYSFHPKKINIPNIVSVHSGGNSSFLLDGKKNFVFHFHFLDWFFFISFSDKGNLYASGENVNGSLFIEKNKKVLVFKQVQQNVMYISVGYNYAMIINSNNKNKKYSKNSQKKLILKLKLQ